jgi:hypothetical protein
VEQLVAAQYAAAARVSAAQGQICLYERPCMHEQCVCRTHLLVSNLIGDDLAS